MNSELKNKIAQAHQPDALKNREVGVQLGTAELAVFVETAAIGMHWVGADGTILWANRSEMELLGYQPGEYIGRNIAEFHADTGVIDDILSRLCRGETLKDCAARLKCKDGSIKHVLIDSSVFWRGQEFVHTQCFTRDVTDQRRTEIRLATQYQVSHVLAQSFTVQEALSKILEAISASSGWEAGAVWSVDRTLDALRCTAYWQSPSIGLTEFPCATQRRIFQKHVGLPGRVWANGQPAWIPNVTEDTNFPRAPVALKEGLRGALGFPIKVADEILGVMEFFTTEVRQPDPEFLEMLTAIGSQIGQFIKRKRGEEALRASEQLNRGIIESSQDCIKILGLDARLQFLNEGAQQALETDIAKLLGVYWPDFWKGQDLEKCLQAIEQAKGGQTGRFEGYCPTVTGIPKWWDVTVSPIFGADGTVERLVAISREITERKRVEAQQQSLYELLAAVNRAGTLPEVFAAALDGICRCQSADRASILFYDDDGVMRFKAWSGLSADYRRAVEGHSPWKADDRDPPPYFINDIAEADLDASLRSVIDREGIRALAFVPITFDHRLLGKFMVYYNKPHLFSREEIRPVENIATQVAFALERQKSGEALEKLVSERTASLREAIAQMEEFSYSISHDLRGPLRAMQGYCHVLMEDAASELTSENLSFLKRIANSAERLDRLVQDVLAYARASRIDMDLKPLSLEPLLAEVLRNYAGDHQPPPEITIQKPLLNVMGHEPSLIQCLSNLISNALKFVAPGTVPNLRVWTEPVQDTVRIWVQDNGIGIHPDHLSKVFQIFERSPEAAAYPGTGVGLAIVKKAIQRMRGEIGVESEPGKGSRFWIQLPRARPNRFLEN